MFVHISVGDGKKRNGRFDARPRIEPWESNWPRGSAVRAHLIKVSNIQTLFLLFRVLGNFAAD